MGLYRQKKAIAPLLVVLIILGVLVLIYILLYLPIPAFTSIRYTINYWSILLAFFTIQVGLIYVVIKLISSVRVAFSKLKSLDKDWLKTMQKWVRTHFRL